MQINFFETFYNWMYQKLAKQEETDTDSSFCEDDTSEGFEKLKYEMRRPKKVLYSDYYELNVIPDKIIVEIELKLNPFVKKSQRITTQLLDLLGDIGGFYATADLFLFLFGGYFSSRFYQAAIAKDLYFKKVNDSKGDPINESKRL